MTYYSGFLLAVPTANKQKYIDHAKMAAPMFKRFGALRMVEAWGVDVPRGKVTDFYMATQAKDDESVVFSWIEWPDKATRDKGMASVMDAAKIDPRLDPEKNPMPFDGSRMIFGGFTPVVQLAT